MSEQHFGQLSLKNPDITLHESRIRFKPYSTNKTVPLIGCFRARLRNNLGRVHTTTVYVVEGESESLLGREDAEALGILNINSDGHKPQEEERLRCITPEILRDPIKTGPVSGGKSQKEIDAQMDKIAREHHAVFEGMGRAKVDPIHIQVKPDAIPISQGKRPIPMQYKKAVSKKLKEMKAAGLVEGPLPPGECKGWITNMVITKKSWSTEEVRINLDTKRINDHLVPTKIPIPSSDDMRHELQDSDRFTALDCRDSFFHFLLDPDTQELFKFHTDEGIYRFLVLVMGTPPTSGECHAAMSKILQGLDGVLQIKDDILVHGKGDEHDERLKAMLNRLFEFGIRLRREKCKLGQQAVVWFGHIYTKQGMSPDPEKVEHIQAWAPPRDKTEVKSFLQTVQFVAQYMRSEDGRPHADVTAPLRELTKKNTQFKWSQECQESYDELKRRISDRTVLVHFEPDRETRLYVDHGPSGIASTLAQKHEAQPAPVWKAVHHMSRSLVKSEMNYHKIEGESLAIYSGVLMNRRYLSGTKFTVMTDHSSLPGFYNNTSRIAPHRVDRHRGRLGAFNLTVQYVPGENMPCDSGSRHPDPIPENLTASERGSGNRDGRGGQGAMDPPNPEGEAGCHHDEGARGRDLKGPRTGTHPGRKGHGGQEHKVE